MTRRLVAAFGLVLAGCGSQLDAGSDVLHGALPVDERSAAIVINDGGRDNWQGEYAAILASAGHLELVGLIVNSNAEYPSIEFNVTNYRQMVRAARESGLRHVPDPTASIAPTLVRPESGAIDDTTPNHSEGARLILEAAAAHATSVHPLAIATGGALTDVADAYLLDPTLAERAVVVASLGQTDGEGATAVDPNGNRDSWATRIVTARMRYVQVNGYYDQLLDLPEDRVTELPTNPFGEWMAGKRADILDLVHACDQVSVLAVALPWFATDVVRMRADDAAPTTLVPDLTGKIWNVRQSESDRARELIWSTLKDPLTFQ
ncbi:MAG TPA: hypothetical protein VHP33_24820 [Polyangiaceae bacterium]|nr:hypothetical protein [Polyangiaceae bacterium]